MTLQLVTIGKLALPALAVSAAIFGMAENGQARSPLPENQIIEIQDLTCGFSVTNARFGQTYTGEVTANAPVSGRFEISFIASGANSASVKQTGTFDLDAGESTVLGRASFGKSADVDAQMTLSWGKERITCIIDQPIDL